MPTVYCYPVKLTIADLIRAKSMCSQTQFSRIINRLLTSLVRSVLWNIRPLFFAWTSLLRRSVHNKTTSVWYFTVQTSRSVNKPLVSDLSEQPCNKSANFNCYKLFHACWQLGSSSAITTCWRLIGRLVDVRWEIFTRVVKRHNGECF
jgi:hypothetical protein